jgi:predicted esterase
MQEYHIDTTVSGRFLVEPSSCKPSPLLVGFHGYGQTAEDEIALLRQIPGSCDWLCCSIEALHPFYNAKGNLGACWMTSRERERCICENVRYADAVIKCVKISYAVSEVLVFQGFSQGTAMACRAALLGGHRASGVMLLGGDIPPELEVSGGIGRVHLARGSIDRFYPQEQYERDAVRLLDAAVTFDSCLYKGSHWANEEYFKAAGEFLRSFF